MSTLQALSTTTAQTNGAVVNQLPDDTLIDCKIEDLHYGKFKAVRDISMQIKKNTITAFIGPSGCGKSTALRLSMSRCGRES